jgi:hypothetical protein
MAGLTPLQLIAGAGLGNNTALAPSSDYAAARAAYRSTSLLTPFAATLGNSQAPGTLGPGGAYANLLILTAATCPPLSDSTPAAFAGNLGILLSNSAAAGNRAAGFTSVIQLFGSKYLGSGDNSIFVQIFNAAEGFIATTNESILTVNNSNAYFGSSFTTMNSLITGELDQINLAFSAFGTDLKNIGVAIDLGNLTNLGSPLALLQQITSAAGLTPRLLSDFASAGVDLDVVDKPPETLSRLLAVEKTLYRIFQSITGSDLTEILQLLAVETPGIQTLADLLNPVKIFPTSFFSLTVKTVNGLRGIYLDQSGSVNNQLINSLPEYVLERYRILSQVTPPDQALANQCIRVSLQQIKNIFDLTLPLLAECYLNLSTTRGLTQINALTSPVPESVLNFYRTNYATGTGPEGTLVLSDFIGAAAGIDYTDRIVNTIAILNSVTTNTNIINLTATYQRMNILMNSLSNWGDPAGNIVVIPSGIAAGTYTATYETVTITPEPPDEPFEVEVLIETAGGNAFRTGLIPNAESFINSFITTNPATATTLSANWVSMAQKLIRENNNLAAANIVIEELIPNQRTAILGFVQNLPEYGRDTIVDGTAVCLEQVANKSTIGGQAIVGSLRQGRNQAVLDAAGIGTNIEIPATYQSPPPQADVVAAEYSESEAANLVVR